MGAGAAVQGGKTDCGAGCAEVEATGAVGTIAMGVGGFAGSAADSGGATGACRETCFSTPSI